MDFIPNELCYQFKHNGNIIEGFIEHAPDLVFVLSFMNKVFVENDVDLRFSLFPAKHRHVSVLRAPNSVNGNILGPIDYTTVVRVNGNDEIKFCGLVAGINRFDVNRASVFEMFFVDKPNMVSGLNYALNSSGLYLIDEQLHFPSPIITLPLGVSRHISMVGRFKDQRFKTDDGRCVVTVSKTEKYPDADNFSVFGETFYSNTPLGNLYTIPPETTLAFETNSVNPFVINASCTKLMTGMRDSAYSALQSGTITQIQFEELFQDVSGGINTSELMEFDINVRTAAEASNGCGRTSFYARLAISSSPHFIYVNDVLISEEAIRIDEISLLTNAALFQAANLSIDFYGIFAEFRNASVTEVTRVRLQVAGPDTDPQSAPFAIPDMSADLAYSEVIVDYVQNTAKFCLLPRSNT